MRFTELHRQVTNAALARAAPAEAQDADVVVLVLDELARRPDRYDAEPGLLLEAGGGDLAGAGIGELAPMLLPYVAVAGKLLLEHLLDLGADSAAHGIAGRLSRLIRRRRAAEVPVAAPPATAWTAQQLEAARAHVEQLAAGWRLSPQERARCLLAVVDTVQALAQAEPAPRA